MVYKCCAYSCKSGYESTTNDAGVTFHAFPLDPQQRLKWKRANPRKDFSPTKYSRLCSLHFQPGDFVEVRQDTNKSRSRKKCETPLKRRLKDGAVPSVFPEAPKYLSTPAPVPRPTTKTSSVSRREAEAQQMNALEESFRAIDDITDSPLSDVMNQLAAEATRPAGFTVSVVDDSLLICFLRVIDAVPEVAGSITVKTDKTVVCVVEQKIVPACQYNDLLPDHVTHLSQIINLMARVKSWINDSSSKSFDFLLQTAVAVLLSVLSRLPDSDSAEYRQISFIVEQLQLLQKNKHGRHYSPQLTVFAFILHATSPAAYNVLLDETVLCLPSVNTLKKVTRHLHTPCVSDNTSYLKLRASTLNAFERNALLMIDEIYVAKRVECSGGAVQGLTADGGVASTLLCFMIKSVCSKYRDIVAIYPMDRLSAAKQNDCYMEVMAMLRKTEVNVVAISVDNAATNRKFYTDFLCGGQLTTSVVDNVTGQPIFLIFDPVHTIKNVYNNFQRRRIFECPPMVRNLPDGCSANFQHIADLYNKESSMSLKKAHKLSPAALNPKSIEKTSVKLAVSVFSESTRDALRFYAEHEGEGSWSATADFISLVLKLWNVLNVKTRDKGKQKRDYTMDPVRSSLDWKLDFLREFADFLQRWENSRKAGLSKETFLALRHTCLAMADCTSFLLDRLGHQYVLLGQLQSDAIESRFGWLRQLSGANYYISVRQVLESDRRIRAVSLLKFSRISLAEIDSLIQSGDFLTTDDSAADSLADALTFCIFPSANDANIIFYVSGYMARSVIRSTKCDHCRECLITSDTLDPLDAVDKFDYSVSVFLDAINRGGLQRPSEFTFLLAVHCWRVFEEIKSTPELMNKFLTATSHRALFCKIMDRACCTETFGDTPIDSNVCVAGHDVNKLLVERFFNCVSKNLVKDITAKANPTSQEPSKKRRKVAKLQSETAQK